MVHLIYPKSYYYRLSDRSFGISSREPFQIELYSPHSFGLEPEFFDYLGEHPASYALPL